MEVVQTLPEAHPPSVSKWKQTFFAGTVVVLLTAVAAQWTFSIPESSREKMPLRNRLPTKIGAWIAEDLPVAETELLRDRVNEYLNFSDALVRRFSNGDREFTLYVAYWKPGQFDPRVIGQHVPDVCWTGCGWSMERKPQLQLPTISGEQIWPGEYRVFTLDKVRQYVAYWHMVGNMPAADAPDGRTLNIVKAVLRRKSLRVPEQHFIRLSSAEPMENLWQDASFRELMQQLLEWLKRPEGKL